MIYATKDEKDIQVLQSKGGKKLGGVNSKPDEKLTKWDAKFNKYSAFPGMPAYNT